MTFGDALRWLNIFAIPNENLNGIAIAICALISVFAIHETLESFLVSANRELTSESVLGYLILRSHSSFSKLLSIFLNRILVPQGTYHPANCRCAEVGAETLPSECACAFRRNDAPVFARILVKTSVLRGIIFAIEIAFLCLALTVPRNTPLSGGRYAFTVRKNDFGKQIQSPMPADADLGCYEVFKDEGILVRSINFNRVTQLVQCTVKLRPAAVPGASTIKEAGSPPPGFSTFVFDMEISGDDATILDVGKQYDGAETYAYWKSKGTVAEGPVPMVAWGQKYTPNRTNDITASDLVQWRREVDTHLREILGGAYKTAYGGARKWDSADEDLIRMVFYMDWTALPKQLARKGNDAMGYLLDKLVGLQKKNEASPSRTISYSDGTAIRVTKAVLEHIITGPILGLAPWVLVMITVLVVRALFAWLRPNRFFELMFVVFRTFTPVRSGPVRTVTSGRLVFTAQGLFFVQEVQD